MESNNAKLAMQLGKALVKMRNSITAKFDLTSGQLAIMVFLLHNLDRDEINQLDVQNDLLLTHQTVTGMIKRLEEKRFILSSQSRRDGRYKCITVTAKALELKDSLEESAKIAEDCVVSGMSESEQKEFNRLLFIALTNISLWKASE